MKGSCSTLFIILVIIQILCHSPSTAERSPELGRNNSLLPNFEISTIKWENKTVLSGKWNE